MIKMENNLLKNMVNWSNIGELPEDCQEFLSRASGELMDHLRDTIATSISELQALEFDLLHDKDISIEKPESYTNAQYRVLQPVLLSFMEHIEAELKRYVEDDQEESEVVGNA